MPEPATPDRPWRCRLCGFTVPVDEVELRGVGVACVCTRCYHRETDTELVMAKDWRQRWTAAINEIP